MYKRERDDRTAREHAAALAEDKLRYWVKQSLEACSPNFRRHVMEERPDLFDSFMETLRRDAVVYDVAQQRLAGVETRHGWHDRGETLRHGVRYGDDCGAFRTEWFVLYATPLLRRRGRDGALAAVRNLYGVEVSDYDTGMPEVSPSGRWFGSVCVRWGRSRVLVRWDHAQDV